VHSSAWQAVWRVRRGGLMRHVEPGRRGSDLRSVVGHVGQANDQCRLTRTALSGGLG
jgi:hypothetical protein